MLTYWKGERLKRIGNGDVMPVPKESNGGKEMF